VQLPVREVIYKTSNLLIIICPDHSYEVKDGSGCEIMEKEKSDLGGFNFKYPQNVCRDYEISTKCC